MNVAELLSKGLEFQKQSDPRKAERFYRRALARAPDHFDALYLLGIARAQQGDLAEAITLLERASRIDESSAVVLLNLGNALKLAGRHEDAAGAFERSLRTHRSAEAYVGLGDCRRALRQWREAVEAYSAAFAINPNDTSTLSVLVETKRSICDWRGIAALEDKLIKAVENGSGAVFAYLLQNVTDDPALHLKNVRTFIEREYSGIKERKQQTRRSRKARVRLGYFSSDFREHPVAHLAARLFELHDRSRFELVAISHGPNDKSPIRNRIEAAFDRFLDLSQRPTSEILPLVASLELDIAVDLNGHTKGARMDLFASRAAPLQVAYLGYPGTSGAAFFDYAVVDGFVVPEDARRYFTEALAILPSCYLPNDGQLEIAEATPARSEEGLPDEAFVFCCFNKLLKITPEMFQTWARMLTAVQGSVLWLSNENQCGADLLRAEAAQLGIDPRRLIFADRLPHPRHLARHKLADLFLDTLPYNAHATAIDALWAGLPVLTCSGRAFAGRVAGSLLHTLSLPELITASMAEYEALGIRLARDPAFLGKIRSKLAVNLRTGPLFDNRILCRHLEAAYLTMWDRYCGGMQPESFSVSAV